MVRDFWYLNLGRVISLVIAGIYLIVTLLLGKEYDWLKTALFVILPLACIWFGEELGEYEGPSMLIQTGWMRKTPGCFIRFIGWIFLLAVGLMLYFVNQ